MLPTFSDGTSRLRSVERQVEELKTGETHLADQCPEKSKSSFSHWNLCVWCFRRSLKHWLAVSFKASVIRLDELSSVRRGFSSDRQAECRWASTGRAADTNHRWAKSNAHTVKWDKPSVSPGTPQDPDQTFYCKITLLSWEQEPEGDWLVQNEIPSSYRTGVRLGQRQRKVPQELKTQ